MTNLDAYLVLNAVAGLGPKRVRTLIRHFGSVEAVMKATRDELCAVEGIPEHAVLNFIHFSKDKFLSHEYNLMRSFNVTALCEDDDEYPELLKEICDAPLVLYVRGSVHCLKEPGIAVVGSRRASLYGIGIANRFSMELAQAGLSIVSGLARGIDTAAHQGALKAQGLTVAVLGCGLSTIYPAENEPLAEAICTRGAVISEFSMETPPVSFNFPRRNRIISGLSQGVLVVEAAVKSGALITSDFALEQGRDVFAVPGNVGDASSQGTNVLIQQGAKLTVSTEDILQDLAPGLKQFLGSSQETDNQKAALAPLSPEENALYSVFAKDDALHIDELAEKAGMSVMSTALVLFKLELKKIIKKLPGQNYQKVK